MEGDPPLITPLSPCELGLVAERDGCGCVNEDDVCACVRGDDVRVCVWECDCVEVEEEEEDDDEYDVVVE